MSKKLYFCRKPLPKFRDHHQNRIHDSGAGRGRGRGRAGGREERQEEQEAEETEDPLHLAAAAGAGGDLREEPVPRHVHEGGDRHVDQPHRS